MTDEGTRTSRKGSKDDPAADDEISAELSRAAREAVRQPPDPRLEASFAKLGLWSEPSSESADDAPTRSRDQPAPDQTGHDHEELRAAVAQVQGTLDVLARRAELATRLGFVAIGLLVVVALLVLVRPTV